MSCENQETADERIPILLNTPAAHRFISLEPLIGPIDLSNYLWTTCRDCNGTGTGLIGSDGRGCNCARYGTRVGYERRNQIDWVIVGGESGPKARPCQRNWIRDIVRQCKQVGVKCFVKQLGDYCQELYPNGHLDRIILNHRAGADPSEWPEDLRVRETPDFTRLL